MNLSGNIVKKAKTRKGQSWQLTVEMPRDPITGERNRKYKTVTGTKKEAEQELRRFINELEHGEYIADNNITVSAWMQKWLEVYAIPTVSPTTLVSYKGMNRRYIEPMIGHLQVQELNALAVQIWVNKLRESPISGKPLSAATIKHTYHVLRGAMDKAVQAGLIHRSPCAGIQLPKGEKKKPVIYDEMQIQQLLDFARGTEMELIIDLELCMGMRRGELLGLQWKDIDWDKNQIHIIRSRVAVDGKSVVKQPKTESGTRTVDVPEILMKKLRSHKVRCMEQKIRVGRRLLEEDFIIVHPDGKPIYPEYVSQLFTKLQKRANLPKCRFHDLRHLCASIMVKQGVEVKVAQERLGHKDITTTMNIYAHVLPGSAREAAEKTGQLVYKDQAV